ncbi:hypothetical protein [Lacinutrix jangbogonensis]|uniref:hypothetical protein n=1 Tax=Lacinutrix jangbogonensis TaxID=1469557 RepID=UPI00053D316C|nr:hypothetical protein [Lacinutrix jangbogonensis]
MNNLLILLITLLSYNLAISQIEVTEDNAIDEYEVAFKKRLLNDDAFKEYKCNDTLFILFKNSKKKNKRISIENKNYNGRKFVDTTILYYLSLKDSYSIHFVYRKYLDFDKVESNTPSIVIKKNKRFLRKNKKRILDRKFLRKYEHYETD